MKEIAREWKRERNNVKYEGTRVQIELRGMRRSRTRVLGPSRDIRSQVKRNKREVGYRPNGGVWGRAGLR